jgi:hypothetical protein
MNLIKFDSRQDIVAAYSFPNGRNDEIGTCWFMISLESQLRNFNKGLGRITYFKTIKRDLETTPYVEEFESAENSKTIMHEMITDYILYTDYTQSLGGQYDLPFAIDITGNVRSSSIYPITASFIYTSSATYPSLSDTNWKFANNFVTGGVDPTRGREYVWYSGSQSLRNVDMYTSSSNYYYFKLTNGSGSTIAFNNVTTGSVGAFTTTINTSGSRIIQFYINSLTASDANEIGITIQ